MPQIKKLIRVDIGASQLTTTLMRWRSMVMLKRCWPASMLEMADEQAEAGGALRAEKPAMMLSPKLAMICAICLISWMKSVRHAPMPSWLAIQPSRFTLAIFIMTMTAPGLV